MLGDDNLFGSNVLIDEELIKKEYAKYGLDVKVIR